MMKTNISIPNSVFKRAEKLAKSLDMSLSEFYTAALSAYIESYKNNFSVTEKLNQIYKSESSSIDPELVKLQVTSLGDEDW